ncbi:MAG: dihydroorotase, partial [Proteobacteria bacterium]|nr:dihydroorotase [Pseudomonadota bacterium]
MSQTLLFINAHILCPEQKLDQQGWLLAEEGIIRAIGSNSDPLPEAKDAQKIDCTGDILAPGLVDMRVQSGDPG